MMTPISFLGGLTL